MTDAETRKRAQVIDTRAELMLREVEAKAEIAKLKATESAKDTASKHLAQFAGLYLLILVLAFIGTVAFIESEAIAVVAGLVTLVVTNLSTILKSIVEEKAEDTEEDKA
tara:strand:- start:1449 stop:1775 length:327 start_codon:yes stop_codon:yes gene_type:complete